MMMSYYESGLGIDGNDQTKARAVHDRKREILGKRATVIQPVLLLKGTPKVKW